MVDLRDATTDDVVRACTASILLLLQSQVRSTANYPYRIARYINHIMKFLDEPRYVCVHAVGLLKRILTRAGLRYLDHKCIFEFILIAFILSSAVMEDLTYTKSDWIRVAYSQFNIGSIIDWEKQFLDILTYDVILTSKEFEVIWREIKNIYVKVMDPKELAHKPLWESYVAQRTMQ